MALLREGRRAAALLSWLALALSLAAEAPLHVARAKDARASLVAGAQSYLGAPYRYGGAEPSGFDCSGLIHRLYAESLGLRTPRTVASLHALAEPLARSELQPGDLVFFNTTGPLAHVGLYAGEGRFIHSASEGSRTGVMYSSLEEAYWARSYAGSGRLIPPAEYLGLIFTAGLGPSLGTGPFFRGLSAEAAISRRLRGGLELGLAARPEYDGMLGILRLSLVLAINLDRELRFFFGPALTLGSPGFESADFGRRDFEAAGGILATAGISWSPLRFRAAGLDWALTGELVYSRYVPEATEVEDFFADQAARLRAGLLLKARWSI